MNFHCSFFGSVFTTIKLEVNNYFNCILLVENEAEKMTIKKQNEFKLQRMEIQLKIPSVARTVHIITAR